jgi:drug/metabolite transporter (DMT)-like permease
MLAAVRTAAFTACALVGFAANSLLTRAALGTGRLDAASFTCVRLLTGAVTLLLLTRLIRRPVREGGSLRSAAALAGYAVFFTLAYSRIGAGIGALVLFGSVQITMIGTGLVRGERPRRLDWVGLAIAVTGLVVLTRPGATAPDPVGALLMGAAGACWGAYSLAGRGSRDPLGATAGNFLRACVAGLVFLAVSWGAIHLTSTGLWLATASGALASGVGYTLWYAALPALSAWRAAVVQLLVPVATALAATVLLDEALTTRLAVSTLCIAAGVGITIWPSRAR